MKGWISFQPAALTRRSIRVWRVITSAAHRRADLGSARSTATASTDSPASLASLATSVALASLISAQMTRAPWRANANTVARPIPEAPPVINAIFPSSFMGPLPFRYRMSSHLTCKKCRDALPRLGIGAKPPRLFPFNRVPALAGLAGGRDAFLAAEQRRGRQRRDPLHDLARARRDFCVGDRPLPDAEPNRFRAVENFSSKYQTRCHCAA